MGLSKWRLGVWNSQGGEKDKRFFSSALLQFSSVAQSCPTLCDPMNRQVSLSITSSQSLLKLMPMESVMLSSHLIFCHPLLLLPPIPPSIRVFSNESALRIRWSKYWSFSFPQSQSITLLSLNSVLGIMQQQCTQLEESFSFLKTF